MNLALREPTAGPPPVAVAPWQVLVVDDDPEVHAVTRLGLRDFRFEGRPVQILDADSAAAARELLAKFPDIALVLLDVVMETEHAGLELVHHIREELRNRAVRIVLCTGQPGQAPALEVAQHYQIDDYRTKTELTFERLQVLVTSALRNYRLMRQLELRSDALAQHASELERFTYVASHDMQTPLRNIVRLVQLMERRLSAHLKSGERELMDLIVVSTRDLQNLIEDLLALARVGRAEMPLGSVDLNQTVGRVREQLRGLIEERGVHLDCGDLPICPATPCCWSSCCATSSRTRSSSSRARSRRCASWPVPCPAAGSCASATRAWASRPSTWSASSNRSSACTPATRFPVAASASPSAAASRACTAATSAPNRHRAAAPP